MFEDDEGENSMLRKIVDVTHNAVTRMELPREGTNEPREVWVHRKGAAPADRGVAPCPGSRGDYSWLLQPVGDGVLNGTLKCDSRKTLTYKSYGQHTLWHTELVDDIQGMLYTMPLKIGRKAKLI